MLLNIKKEIYKCLSNGLPGMESLAEVEAVWGEEAEVSDWAHGRGRHCL